MAKRTGKRKRSAESTSGGRRKKQGNSPEIEEEDEIEAGQEDDEQHTATEPNTFNDFQVEWEYIRYKLAKRPRKTMLTGYELMTRDINAVLKARSSDAQQEIKTSCMGCFLKLEDYNTKNSLMIHYVVFREVKATPNPDKTALWFNICGKILRFSREEYALLSGLHFGQANFNPYKAHRVDENSIFARLFRCNEKTTTNDVYQMFKKQKFWYYEGEGENEVEVVLTATDKDFVKLAKLLLATTFVLGYEGTKKAIPVWLWVLLEDEDAWEEFPWGSFSYQALITSIKAVKTDKDRVPKSGTISYHITGNILAFSAWIFEAIPEFGKKLGSRKTKRKKPRFLRYKYEKDGKLPTEKDIKKELVEQLKPTKRELSQPYWTSLMNDPTGMPFAFLYDPNDSRKKRTNEIVLASNASTTSANIQLTDDQLKKIGEFAAEATEKKMKVHIDASSMKLGKVLEALGMGPNDDIRDDDQALYNYNKLMSSLEHDEPIDAEEEAAIDEAMVEADVNADKGASTVIDESNKEAAVNAKKGAADATEKTSDTISSIDHDEAVKAVAEAAAKAAEEAAAEKARAKRKKQKQGQKRKQQLKNKRQRKEQLQRLGRTRGTKHQ